MSDAAEFKHTPGPWHWVDGETDEPYDFDSESIGTLSLRTVETFGENKTEIIGGNSYTNWALPKFILDIDGVSFENPCDARLIAAAPELLEALRELEESTDWVWDNRARVKARAAIAKATGNI